MLKRIILIICVIGMPLSIHLAIQKQRGFDRGCWGVATATSEKTETGCNSAKLTGLSRLYGAPTALLACASFILIGGLTLAQLSERTRIGNLLRVVANVVTAVAMAHAAYLTYYQFVAAKAYCPLCLVISVMILGLFVLHLFPDAPASADLRKEPHDASADGRFAGRATFAGVVMMASMFAVNYDEEPRSRGARDSVSFDAGQWVDDTTPFLGTAGGVKVIAFLDPNCKPCVACFASLVELSTDYKDKAAVYIMPRMLWKYSQLQTQALEVARAEGKYFEMWRSQFARQQPGGLDSDEVAESLRDVGIATEGLTAKIAASKAGVLERRHQAEQAGISSTPTIFVDGEKVSNTSVESLKAAVKRAAEKRTRAGDRRVVQQ